MPIPYPNEQRSVPMLPPDLMASLQLESERRQQQKQLTAQQIAALKMHLKSRGQPPQNMPQGFGNSPQGGSTMMPQMAPEMFGLPPLGNVPDDGLGVYQNRNGYMPRKQPFAPLPPQRPEPEGF